MLSDAIFCYSKQSTILWVRYDFYEPGSNKRTTAVCNKIEVFSLTDEFVEVLFSLVTHRAELCHSLQ